MTGKIAIERRRDQVRRLYIRGLSASEIAASLNRKWSLPTISRDLARINNEGAKWWSQNSKLEERLPKYLKERYDTLKEVEKEAWIIHNDSSNSPRTRLSALGLVTHTEQEIRQALGFGFSVNEMEMREKVEQLENEITELREQVKRAITNKSAP